MLFQGGMVSEITIYSNGGKCHPFHKYKSLVSLILIHWKVIYLVDSTIHPLNTEPAPEKDTEAVTSFNNTMDIQRHQKV